MTPPVYNFRGQRKKGSDYNLNNIADFHKKEIRCFYCHHPKELERDHIIPLWLGGDDQLNNLQILCNVCHRQKTREENEGLK